MNVLLIATRPPYGQMVGHKQAIRTYIQSLQRLGHRVIVAAFAIPGEGVQHEDLDVQTHYFQLPGKARIVHNAVAFGGQMSINECLYFDKTIRRRIIKLADDAAIDLVVADMIRTAPYAQASGRPWMLDLDDLLSERYAKWATRQSDSETILGYLEPVVPAILRPVVRSIFRKMLRRESRVLANREVYWVSRSHASSLRSIDETERLRRRAPGAQVFSLPVAVPIPPQPAHRLSRRPMIAVFTGGLGYRPNLEALRAYVQQIIPAFGRRGISPPNLHVIGSAPDALRRGVEHPSVRFLGYVSDLNSELLQAQVFFAPIVSGSGVKTKVLEALACGLPVIGLPLGLAGLRGQSGRDYLEARDPTEFVNQFVRLDEDSMLAQSIGAAARKLAVEHYSLDATTRILGEQVGALDFSNGTSDPSRREMADLVGGRFARLGSKRRDGPARVTPGG